MVSSILRSLRWMVLLEGEMQAAPGSSEWGALTALSPFLRTGQGQAAASLLVQGVHCKMCRVPAQCANMPCTSACSCACC